MGTSSVHFIRQTGRKHDRKSNRCSQHTPRWSLNKAGVLRDRILPDHQKLNEPLLQSAHAALVSENASFFTPGAIDGRVEAIAIDGDTVFVGGTFTKDFDPVLNGAVRALHNTGEGTGIFVGGEFTSLNGQFNRKGLVKLDNFGDRVRGFSARPDKRVYTMQRVGNTLYIGGNFERIGQVPVEYLAALNTETGEVLPNLNFDFDGIISTHRTTGASSVDVIEVTSDNQLMVIAGNFLSINGLSRSRLALIDDSFFVTGTTGGPRTGNPACDTILRFDLDDLSDTNAEPSWINYTGGDSVYEVTVTEHAIYTGGHFRWLNNAFGRDYAGPGAVPRRGLAARGVGVFSLESEPEGLYIGDDTNFLNGFEHLKFKFLPITENTIKRPTVATLPTSIFTTNADALDARDFDGTTL